MLTHAINAAVVLAIAALVAGAQSHRRTVYAVVWGHPAFVVGSSTRHSGLYRSADEGRTWNHLGPDNLKAFSMCAVDSARGRVIYIAAGNGVHRSIDSGRTWKILTDWRVTEVLGIAVNQAEFRWLYAATAFGFWRSSDAGNTWERPAGELHERYVSRIRSAGGGTLEAVAESRYAEDYHTNWLSSDHGATWRQVGSVDAIRYTMVDSTIPAMDIAGIGQTTLAATWGNGVMRLDEARWVPSGLDGRQVWDLVVTEY